MAVDDRSTGDKSVVVTGAAGLVGQNLIPRLKAAGHRVVAIDKHPTNTAMLRELHPDITVIEANLATPGDWQAAFAGADCVVLNQAQIGGLERGPFVANNVTATELILGAVTRHGVPHIVHISSSVVNSQADDLYVETKTAQELIVAAHPTPHLILRPTLMFGWFDRKHLGWLRRFMDRAPVFPVPGNGRYRRQPLYAGDFAAIIAAGVARSLTGTFDISGRTEVDYVELIDMIRRTVGARTRIVHIPFGLFWALLWVYARFDRDPPFTTHQLEALVIPEVFPIIDWPTIFGVAETPLDDALAQTFLDPRYGRIVLDF
ncbi:NAD(P)-dependent oxidoreductase [Phenylobacterium sp.]|uniref:NAD-dependent epimerase/dehydratase family protein n=1 Tax=Phenylobacterium sp. TaxID=1871053 RepID=UPI0027365315|nr:NAD-dependent epimerase/dehydratase family protein [Phenylobacterium sp.]MDP3659469.1 NAD-dependent epimerase/dehydratase family protein [Phenylobacterium sp.]